MHSTEHYFHLNEYLYIQISKCICTNKVFYIHVLGCGADGPIVRKKKIRGTENVKKQSMSATKK